MKHMPSIINRGLSSATTEDWLNATKDMKLSASDPCPRDLWASFVVNPEHELGAPQTVETAATSSVHPHEHHDH
jgi:hypothetical protein